MTRRSDREDDTGKLLMRNKLKDSRREQKTFRKERNKLRKELEKLLTENKFLRRMRRLKQLLGVSTVVWQQRKVDRHTMLTNCICTIEK